MAIKGIREYDAKRLLAKNLNLPLKVALVTKEQSIDSVAKKNAWMKKGKLVVKPDQLFGKRGKHKLLLLDATFAEAKRWLKQKMGKQVTVGKTTGTLDTFIIEPFVPHEDEYYVAIKSSRDYDSIYFSTKGGIYVEENWDKVLEFKVPTLEELDLAALKQKIPSIKNKDAVLKFIQGLYEIYTKMGFSYLEINPIAVDGSKITPLDLVAKLDDTAAFENKENWTGITFPGAFGSSSTKEEKYIKRLDAKSGSSLKLTILNPAGKIWTMVAGGGASVIYTDTIVDLGFGQELANYGEYSGNPNTEETYEYASTILDLMTRDGKKGKVLLIGGGIANFTDVAKTFTGIIMALKDYAPKLRKNKVKIFVRRGGPNYKEGLKKIEAVGKELNLPIAVYGPETHMTKIVPMALK